MEELLQQLQQNHRIIENSFVESQSNKNEMLMSSASVDILNSSNPAPSLHSVMATVAYLETIKLESGLYVQHGKIDKNTEKLTDSTPWSSKSGDWRQFGITFYHFSSAKIGV